MQNNSAPLGSTGWFQGNIVDFYSHQGAPSAYIGANFNNTAGVGIISNWLMTPELHLTNSSVLAFWTRIAIGGGLCPDRLEVRLSTEGGSVDVGGTSDSVGDFDTLLLSVNPDLNGVDYPEEWTRFAITLANVPIGTTGRIAFRYFVTNGGPSGANSNYIGIDTVSYTSEMVAVGSRFAIGATEAGVDGDLFMLKPKVYATFTHPFTGKAGKASAKVLTKPVKGVGADVVECDWTKKIRLYDAKGFKAAQMRDESAAIWAPANQDDRRLVLRVAGKEIPDPGDNEVRQMFLALPMVVDVMEHGQDAKSNDLLIINGYWFGLKAPKVWREYRVPGKAEGTFVIKRQAMKVVKPTADDAAEGFVDGKGKPAHMKLEGGESRVVVIVPAEPKVGQRNSVIVVDNGIGLATGDDPTSVP
jgi:hypothetical protein